MKGFFLVFASDENGGIGKNGKIPWNVPEDMKMFQSLTINRTVICGRKTFESFPNKKPLKNRQNIVLSKTQNFDANGATVCSSLEEAFSLVDDYAVVIGGTLVYTEALKNWQNMCLGIVRTTIEGNFDCDTFFRVKSEHNSYKILSFSGLDSRMISEKMQGELGYLSLLSKVLFEGKERKDRTGKGTRSLFGETLVFRDIANSFPLLTTKKMRWDFILSELLWFLSGSTDSKVLERKGNNIWKGNTSREFLDKRGLFHYREGDIGKGYGFQWRHSGEEYKGCDANYKGKGKDQIGEIIRLIQEEPESRRILLNSWNVADLEEMALPPCHLLVQFYVDGEYLDCCVYQRSADLALGLPYNVSSYSCLLAIVAKRTNKIPRNLTMNLGDIHLYLDHLENAKKQLQRLPYPFPRLEITKLSDDTLFSLDESDFSIHDYVSHGFLKFEMAK